ncbi:hypothetical protein L596_030698 [Steinernema carpocapsae]|uniref:Citrate transporter-like domain-containing protein n=1 Tax=Steinernema carpocapsae TaxID=34508 RepID=A0A4U5LNH4_STECR|nr:hypothetical protein L596_030698 [Steinernema carpocapsae]
MAAGVKESKLSARIGEMLTILDVLPPMVIMSICIAISVFVTNICANTVTASIFLPIAAEMATSLKIHPLYFMLPITIAASFAFALPVDSSKCDHLCFGSCGSERFGRIGHRTQHPPWHRYNLCCAFLGNFGVRAGHLP